MSAVEKSISIYHTFICQLGIVLVHIFVIPKIVFMTFGIQKLLLFLDLFHCYSVGSSLGLVDSLSPELFWKIFEDIWATDLDKGIVLGFEEDQIVFLDVLSNMIT